jgi:hypothetical protein
MLTTVSAAGCVTVLKLGTKKIHHITLPGGYIL